MEVHSAINIVQCHLSSSQPFHGQKAYGYYCDEVIDGSLNCGSKLC